ncbi:PTS galactitol transporter subunit IIC [Vibrio toranzoniae]|uniref:PTS galactitol transporter subunit IIC n=1 Tax=Vibrio toranzoniae TaxID=1194427 RepID=UPI0013788505|nr:PTS transporter subunit IIC [Vibrio toranzoniae]NAZ94374.1 PTS sugar transporter subunit IIC [Vibrio toranzoniae]
MLDLLNFIVGLGASVLMPIVFIVIGLCIRLRVGQAIKAGLMVGIGFIGLSITVKLMIDSLTPISNAIVEKFGLNLNILDVGWPAAAAVGMGTEVGALIIPLCLIINVIMLYTKTTKVLNVDIWNLWHHAVAGSLVAIMSDSLALGLYAAAINCIITMIIADRTAKDVGSSLGLDGISVPHGFSVSFVPVAWVVNGIINKIPYVRDIQVDTDKIQEKFSILGDPASLGAIIGILLAIIAGTDIPSILHTGITMAAVMTIIPRMAKMLMEGVYPISERIQDLAQTRLTRFKNLTIGLDSAVSVGHPVTLSVSMVMIPVMLMLAAVMPGNQFLPFASLTGLPFAFVLVTAVCKGDFFRVFITGLVTLTLALYIATDLAPAITSVATNNGFAMPDGANMISSIDYAGAMLPWSIIHSFDFKTIGILIATVVTLGLMYLNRVMLIKEEHDA